jgi:tetratricopeptide (TPR) repeat protein
LPEALEKARAVGAADLEARLLYTAGTIQFGRGAFADALPFHEEALRVAVAHDDAEGRALAHHGLCETYFFLGPFARGLEHGRAADLLLRELAQRPMVAHNAYMISWLEWFLGSFDDAYETVNGSIREAREIGNRRDEAFGLNNRAELHLASGALGDALADAKTSFELARELQIPRGEMIARNVRVDVLAETYAFDRLARDAEEALRISDALGGTFQRAISISTDGWLALRGGDRAEAERRFEQAWELAGSTLLDVAWCCRTQILAWEEAGEPTRLEAVGAKLEGALLPEAPAWGAWGIVARALAALLREEWEPALDHAERAIREAARATERRVAWRASRVSGLALHALGRRDEAAVRSAEAAEVVRGMAASLDEEDLRAAFLARPHVSALLTT